MVDNKNLVIKEWILVNALIEQGYTLVDAMVKAGVKAQPICRYKDNKFRCKLISNKQQKSVKGN